MKKKLGFALALAIVSSGALATWEKVASDDDDDGSMYVDRATIRKSGATVKMWDVMSYQKIRNARGVEPFFSIRSLSEYDCNAEKYRLLSYSFHTGKMASGQISSSDTEVRNWKPIPPGTLVESAWQIACNVK